MLQLGSHAVSVHPVDPLRGGGFRQVREPQGLPLLSLERSVPALAVGPLEFQMPGDDRVFKRPAPGGLLPSLSPLADLDHMEGHRRITDHHVPEHAPAMYLSRQLVIIPPIDRDPSVQHATLIGPGKGTPCQTF